MQVQVTPYSPTRDAHRSAHFQLAVNRSVCSTYEQPAHLTEFLRLFTMQLCARPTVAVHPVRRSVRTNATYTITVSAG
jgi:hypothetical protein